MGVVAPTGHVTVRRAPSSVLRKDVAAAVVACPLFLIGCRLPVLTQRPVEVDARISQELPAQHVHGGAHPGPDCDPERIHSCVVPAESFCSRRHGVAH